MHQNAFHRLELLTGSDCLNNLASVRVIVFGVGGVGSWCAEALVRSGIHNLTIVDSDLVCVTNTNRQVQATSLSVGKPKVAELARRLKEINPSADIETIQKVYDRTSADQFDLSRYDYVIDAIDSLSPKIELILNASQAGVTLYSALGAARKIDPTRIRVSSIWQSYNCKLGRFVRKRLRRRGFKGDFLCVWSDEYLFSPGKQAPDQTGDDLMGIDSDGELMVSGSEESGQKQINGSAVHITGTFGFMIAGMLIQDVVSKLDCRNEFDEKSIQPESDNLETEMS
ncbi:MAG: ThiF family adenylyltransferase [Chitinispirillaceae bacterium]